MVTTCWPIGQQIGDRLPGGHLVYCMYIRNFRVLASKPVFIALQRHTGRLVLVKCRIRIVSCCLVLAMLNVCLERVETLCIGNIYVRFYQYCWQLFWKFLKDTLIHPQSAHTLTDKSKRRRHAGRTLNFLMSVCLIVCKCSFSSSKTQHAWTNANVYDCFTMQSVLWPNAPINGGWAVLFTAWKYIFISLLAVA